jgi:hypothetical protein
MAQITPNGIIPVTALIAEAQRELDLRRQVYWSRVRAGKMRQLATERDRADRQRAEDRDNDADRLERIETDIRAMRDLMFEAFQRGRTD